MSSYKFMLFYAFKMAVATLHYLINEQNGISKQGGKFLNYEKQIR